MGNGWFERRRSPRLSGTLHIHGAGGQELSIPLRGRATMLTGGATGLAGYGEIHAVHTSAGSDDVSLMISYGHEEATQQSGLCSAGSAVTLSGVRFTWLREAGLVHRPAPIPAPREATSPHTRPTQPAHQPAPAEQAAPIQATPVQATPVQATPVQATPVQAAPVHTALTNQAAVHQVAPAQRAGTHSVDGQPAGTHRLNAHAEDPAATGAGRNAVRAGAPNARADNSVQRAATGQHITGPSPRPS
ncbi:hypothetical protein [Actinoplanes sp. DH11]|uniref:hypothetical protein n=1 Tax=Actinoplanes sp. DH11 TaxID=2857011 RepID=UPI001E2E44E9|nr:hypothetical protein [Actinoplanes sp. DH11]